MAKVNSFDTIHRLVHFLNIRVKGTSNAALIEIEYYTKDVKKGWAVL